MMHLKGLHIKKLCTLVLSIIVVMAALSAQDLEELNRITFSNQTGYDISYLFFSPGDSIWWGPDILGSKHYLHDGDALSFYLHFPGNGSTFDFFAIDSQGDSYVIADIEVRDEQEGFVEIGLDDLSPGAYGQLNFTELIFTNASDEDIWYLFLSPSDSDMWGIDILDDERIFAVGDSFSILVPTGIRGTSFDLLGLDATNGSLYRQILISSRQNQWYIDITEADRL